MSMPTLALAAANAAASTRAPAQAGARNADSPDGRSFESAFDEMRSARARRAEEPSASAGAGERSEAARPGTRKAGRDDERERTLTPADVMAMLAPLAPSAAPAASDPQLAAGAAATTAALAAQGAAALPATADGAAPTADTPPADGADADRAGHGAKATAKDAAAPAAADDTADTADTPTLAGAAAAFAEATGTPALPGSNAPAVRAASPRTVARTGAADPTTPASGASAAGDADATAAANAAPRDATVDFQAAMATASAGLADGRDGAGEREAGDGDTALPVQFQPAAAAPADRAGATTGASSPLLTLAPKVGDDAWSPALAQQMLRMSASGQHVARLNLNPSELGPLQVTLTMSDQQTQAMFTSAHESVRKALEAALPQLRTTLAAQGIQLGDASVGSQSQQPSGQGGGFANQDAAPRRGTPDYPGTARVQPQAAAPAAAPASRTRASSSLDTFA